MEKCFNKLVIFERVSEAFPENKIIIIALLYTRLVTEVTSSEEVQVADSSPKSNLLQVIMMERKETCGKYRL